MILALSLALTSWDKWDFSGWAIFAVVVCGIIALAMIALKYFDMWPPPPWAMKAFGIVVVVFVIVLAIKIISSL